MDWYKQRVGYYLDPEMIDAGEEAEVLSQRAKAYSAHVESGGYVPERALPLIIPKRWKQRAETLVRVGLWKVVEGGYLILDWDEEQSELEALAARRRSDRERKRAQRERDSSRDKSADKSRDSHVTDASNEDGSGGRQTDVSVKERQKGSGYSPVHPQVTGDSETGNSTDDSSNEHINASQPQQPSRDNFEGKRVEKRSTKYSSSSADADDGPPQTPATPRKRPVPPRFEDFWRTYPRRVGKIAAEKAYAKALAAGTTPDELIAGASFYAMEKKLSDPKYIKHPATWLNDGCWQDEPDPAYKPPVIGAPSEAASAAPPPIGEVLARQASYGACDPDPWTPAPNDPFYEPPF